MFISALCLAFAATSPVEPRPEGEMDGGNNPEEKHDQNDDEDEDFFEGDELLTEKQKNDLEAGRLKDVSNSMVR